MKAILSGVLARALSKQVAADLEAKMVLLSAVKATHPR